MLAWGYRLTKSAVTPSPNAAAGLPLYGADFVKGVPHGSYPFSYTSVSLFDLASRFFAPTHDRKEPARAGARQGWRVAPPDRGTSLTAPSTTAHLSVVGDDEGRGELRVGARRSGATSLYAAGQRPKP